MKKQQGFTLIELMIVVAIIGVLSAIAVPAYQNYVAKSETASAVGTLRGLLTNIDMYQQEHAGTFPPNSEAGLTAIGASEKMNQLGEITLTPDTAASGAGSVEFEFVAGALEAVKAKVKYVKSTSGWICQQLNVPEDARANSCSAAYSK
ncbi:prepilin-type N-terminal cleavage/methylation domain-containing protein [Photobacterium piscicola]|uniref:pilin n=1 Tax=Photobacterium piscicola TaxID=1378299 RepID=UPI002E19FF24|nr:prepilin-type N-terminal cleavage/methylation domain-containing protein [Photobacterium piscicola]